MKFFINSKKMKIKMKKSGDISWSFDFPLMEGEHHVIQTKKRRGKKRLPFKVDARKIK